MTFAEVVVAAAVDGRVAMPADFHEWPAARRESLGREILERAHREGWRDFLRRNRHLPSLHAAQVRREFPVPTIRNLIYHVCPLAANDVWRKNVAQLRRRIDVFNGRRIVAIATGDGMVPAGQVRREIADLHCDILTLPNCRVLREVVSFLPLLLSVANTASNEATFYAHTKGNSTAASVQGATYWRNAAYQHLLDRADDCMNELASHIFVGIHKMVWGPAGSAPYPSRLRVGDWMLCGTFFWFRHDVVFNHPAWRRVPMDRYGAEAWPSIICDSSGAKSMFQLWPENQYPCPTPYDPAIYPSPIED